MLATECPGGGRGSSALHARQASARDFLFPSTGTPSPNPNPDHGRNGGGGRPPRGGDRKVEEQVPLFQRVPEFYGDTETSEHERAMDSLRSELEESKKITEASKHRQSTLEDINFDLERRLENEAKARMELENRRVLERREAEGREAELAKEVAAWKGKFDEMCKRERGLKEQLRNVQKELFRMHQKKYDLARQVRQEVKKEDAEARRQQTLISKRLKAEAAERKEAQIRRREEALAVAVVQRSRTGVKLAERHQEKNMVDSMRHFFGF